MHFISEPAPVLAEKSDDISTAKEQENSQRRLRTLSLATLGMAALQAACAFLILVNTISPLLGAGAVIAAGAVSALHSMHSVWLRYPLLLFAAIGALLALFSQINAWILRNDPAAAWRRRPLTGAQKRRSAMIFATSVITLALIASEFWAHWHFHGHF